MVTKTAKTAGEVAKHPASIWAVVLATAVPALVDRYITQPGKDEQAAAVERVQWEELGKTLEELQEIVDAKWDKGRDEITELKIQIGKLEATVDLLSKGRRSEARRAMSAPPPAPASAPTPSGAGGATKTSRQIELPAFEELEQKARERMRK